MNENIGDGIGDGIGDEGDIFDRLTSYNYEKQKFIIQAGICVLENILPTQPKNANANANANAGENNVLPLQKRIHDLTVELTETKTRMKDIYLHEQEQYSQRLASLRESFQKETRDIYLSKDEQIKQQRETIEGLRSQLTLVQQHIQSQFEAIIREKDSRISEYQSRITEKDVLIDDFRRKERDAAKEEIENTRSVTRGEIGENYIIEQLHAFWNRDWNIIKTSKESESMDIIVKHPLYCIRGGIESKNFTNKVPKRDIDKFKRDLVLRKDYNFAIMISLNSGISNYPDFHIELCHQTEKPLIYVGNANQHKDIYLVLENFLKFYFFKQKDNNEHDYNNLLLKEFTDNYKQYEAIRKNADNILTIAQNRLKELNANSIRIYNHNLKDGLKNGIKNGQSNKKTSRVPKPPIPHTPMAGAATNEVVAEPRPPLVDTFREIIQFEEGSKLQIEQLKIYISSHFDKRYTEYQTNRILISEMKRYISLRGWVSKYNGKKKFFSNLKLVVPE